MIKKMFIAITAVVVAIGLGACGETKQEEPVETAAETAAVETVAETAAETAAETKASDEKETTVKETKEGEENAEDNKDDKAEEEPEEVQEEAEVDADDAAVVPAEVLDEGYVGTVFGTEEDGLMLRSGPDSGYEGLAVVPDDTELYIEAVQDGWGYTNYFGDYGWVYLGYVG